MVAMAIGAMIRIAVRLNFGRINGGSPTTAAEETPEKFKITDPSGRLYLGRRMCRFGENDPKEVLALMQEYGISARLTFSNSLLKEKHLSDRKCNALCALLEENKDVQNGVIVHSDLLLEYLKKHYPHLYFVSSITKVITDFKQLVEEIRREDFRYVVQICMNIPEDSTDYYYLANKKVLGNCRWEGCERYV